MNGPEPGCAYESVNQPNELGLRLAIYKIASLGTLIFSNLV
jgi:hypothetical protein